MGFFSFLGKNLKIWQAASSKDSKERLLEDLNIFVEEIKARKALIPIQTALLLKNNEAAYLESLSTLMETRSVRKHSSSGGGVGFRVVKGVYVSGSSRGGTSESHWERKDIDTGKLTLTDKRLVFDGPKENRIIPLDKIVSVTSLLDSIEIVAEGRNKSMVFTVSNPYIWNFVLQVLAKAEDPKKLDNINLTVQKFNGESVADPLFTEAVEIISQFDQATVSLLQRRLSIGYARAARLLDELEVCGIVGPQEGNKPREVLKK